jgi:8-oxo-dGTP diphosphatase
MEKNIRYNYLKKVFRPLVAVDILIFTIIDNSLRALLIKRNLPPFKDSWAIPGGFVREEESLEQAAKRELKEETNLSHLYLEQLYTFGDPKRDPRGRVISAAYFALVPKGEALKILSGTDADEVKWQKVNQLPKLAFDHKKIINYALQRLRWKLEYTNVAYSLLDEEFTLTELQKVYETVFGKVFDKRNFRKKILSLNLVKPTGKKVVFGVHRPAKTYSFIMRQLRLVDIA